MAWIDGLTTGKAMGRSVLMRGNHAAAAELPARVRDPLAYATGLEWNLCFDLPSATLNRLTVKAFNFMYYAFQRNAPRKLVSFEKFFYPLDAILQWNRMYGKCGLSAQVGRRGPPHWEHQHP